MKPAAWRVSREKACSDCKQVFSIEHFYFHAGKPRSYCKGCASKRAFSYLSKSGMREKARENVARISATPEGKEKRRLRQAKYRAMPANAMRERIGRQMRKALLSGKAGRPSCNILEWNFLELREHIEKQFTPGMGWHNMAKWHIDHIVPLSSFEITGPDCPNLRRAWALTNLRPLWAVENIQKRDKAVFLI